MVVVRAADALVRLGEPAKTIVPYLIDVLHRPEESLPPGRDRITSPCAFILLPEAHCHAARILGEVGPDALTSRAALLDALNSGSGAVRAEAARALAGIGEPDHSFIPSLRHALDDAATQSSRERVWVAEALVELGAPPEPVVAAVAELVQDEDWTAACLAMRLLGDLGQKAKTAIPALKAAANSDKSHISDAANEAIGRIEAQQ